MFNVLLFLAGITLLCCLLLIYFCMYNLHKSAYVHETKTGKWVGKRKNDVYAYYYDYCGTSARRDNASSNTRQIARDMWIRQNTFLLLWILLHFQYFVPVCSLPFFFGLFSWKNYAVRSGSHHVAYDNNNHNHKIIIYVTVNPSTIIPCSTNIWLLHRFAIP